MPRNPNKTRCSIPGCKAWAIRNTNPGASDPPLCAPHSPGRTGAPIANQNRRTHGFYSRYLHPQELADLAAYASDNTLDAEVALARVATRRLLTILDTGTMPGPNSQPLTPIDYLRCIGLTFRGVGLLSRLLRIRHELGSDEPSPFLAALSEALDRMNEIYDEVEL